MVPMGQALEFATTNAYPLVVDGGLSLPFGPNGLVRIAEQDAANEGEKARTVSLRILMPQGMDLLRPVPAVQVEHSQHTWVMDVRFVIYIPFLRYIL